MHDSERFKLLHGPYRAPRCRIGGKLQCAQRGEVTVRGLSDGRIPWPQGVPVGSRSRPALLVNDELARAVRGESALAVMYWWGASEKAVWKFRRALGVGRTDSEGSRRLIQAAAQEGGAAMRQRGVSPAEVGQRRQNAIRLKLGRHLQPGYHGPRWTAEQLGLLGTLPDGDVARQIGRTAGAVRVMRTRLGIASARDRRRREANGDGQP